MIKNYIENHIDDKLFTKVIADGDYGIMEKSKSIHVQQVKKHMKILLGLLI